MTAKVTVAAQTAFFFDALAGLRMTVVSGALLALSLAVLLAEKSVPVDPAWGTILISGSPLVYLALTRLFFQRNISSALLISIAMVASVAIGELFAAGEVAFIMAIGAILEDRTVERAKRGLKQLIGLAPQQGRRIEADREEVVPIARIRRGDVLRVLPGETIPVDGEIVAGSTSIDQSIMTGESLPVDKTVGESVFSGTINRFGAVDIRAAKVGEDSSLHKLIRMVREAEDNKAPMQRIVDRWASWLVPAALLIALVAYVATGDVIRAVTVLVVFCPCALALATPTSIMAAIGQATRHGVLIKSGEALENMGRVDSIAFDKTGTLTHGILEVSDIAVFVPDRTEEQLLGLAAAVESRSEHPLGKAVVARAAALNLVPLPVERFVMVPGKGIAATVGDTEIRCGNSAYLEENGIAINKEIHAALAGLRQQGKAGILVAEAGRCIGMVALSDTLREGAAEMVRRLRQMGTEVVLLTGDHAHTAAHFAARADIDQVRAELLPAQKVEWIKTMQAQGRTVCMIGDGVNDAPALKTADVGVAMGTMGSDIAIEAADIALMGDDIGKLPYLKRLSNVTIRTIKGNIALAMLINCAAIAMSVMGLLTPITGALVHNAGSVLIVLNAARLYDRKLN
ncbi:MAG: cation-translocating P-type ATPase [Desulfobulbus sp.]|jgi:heavy metal translocating P-type ATPase|uniref:heavy metal translocating P-type ATPase n=1 Tax=Desulfobulbus sp. TaxID=895 RepID=UPI00284C6AB2|nr:cation-translocating P-type ATPase [Desulfobulbus sp.]MDR2549046.1 cation-translocating P-type ATPase [Desulfobulbus sp.]